MDFLDKNRNYLDKNRLYEYVNPNIDDVEDMDSFFNKLKDDQNRELIKNYKKTDNYPSNFQEVVNTWINGKYKGKKFYEEALINYNGKRTIDDIIKYDSEYNDGKVTKQTYTCSYPLIPACVKEDNLYLLENTPESEIKIQNDIIDAKNRKFLQQVDLKTLSSLQLIKLRSTLNNWIVYFIERDLEEEKNYYEKMYNSVINIYQEKTKNENPYGFTF